MRCKAGVGLSIWSEERNRGYRDEPAGKLSTPQAPNGELRLVFKISTADAGALRALVYAIDRDPTPFNATSVTLKGSTLQVSIQLLQSVFEGTLGGDGNTITGKWTQAATALPLNLVRATEQTAWAIPELPPSPVRMSANATLTLGQMADAFVYFGEA